MFYLKVCFVYQKICQLTVKAILAEFPGKEILMRAKLFLKSLISRKGAKIEMSKSEKVESTPKSQILLKSPKGDFDKFIDFQ